MNDDKHISSRCLQQSKEDELRQLRDGILSLVGEQLVQARDTGPVAGGITRLGKFEAILPESRFRQRPQHDLEQWLCDSLQLRLRRGLYSSGAVVIPQDPNDQAQAFRATLTTTHQSVGQTLRYQMQVKSKRPGQITISRPVAV